MSNIQLTSKQDNVKDRVIQSKGKEIITLRGFAGTGKTITAIEIIKHKLQDNHSNKVCVMAPTNAALGVLRNKLQDISSPRLQFKTLAGLMTEPQQYVQFMDFKFNLDDVGMHELTTMLEKFKCDFIHKVIVKDKQVRFDQASQQYVEDEIYVINKEQLYQALSLKLRKLNFNDIKVDVEFIYSQPSEIRDKLKSYDLVIIDEMPMVNQDEVDLLEDAMRLANHEQPQSKHAKNSVLDNASTMLSKYPTYLFVGDNAQLQPVKGKTNQYMIEKAKDEENNIYELTDILRSTDEISKMGKLIRKGVKLKDLVDFYSDQMVIIDKNPEKFIDEHIEEIAEGDINLTLMNKHVKMINDKVRHYHGYDTDDEVKKGEQIIVKSTSYGQDGALFANGEEYFIKEIYDRDAVLEMLQSDDSIFTNIREMSKNDKKLKEVFDFVEVIVELDQYRLALLSDGHYEKYAWIAKDLKYFGKSFSFENSARRLNDLCRVNGDVAPVVKADFGYARTVHTAQGSEWKNVNLFFTNKDLWITKGKSNLPYTAVTRAKENLKIFIEK